MLTGKEKDEIIKQKFTFCLFPGCKKLQGENGVCDFHKQWIQNDIDDGAATLEDYVLRGHAMIGFADEQPDYPRDLRFRVDSQQTCIAPECEQKATTRGLCMNHYQVCRNLVKQKHTTWDLLEERGFSLPKKSSIKITKKFRNSIVTFEDPEPPPREEPQVKAPLVNLPQRPLVPQPRPACFNPEPTEKKEETMSQLDEADRHLGRRPPVPIPSRGSHPKPQAPLAATGVLQVPKPVRVPTPAASAIPWPIPEDRVIERNTFLELESLPEPALEVMKPAPPVSLPSSILIGQQKEMDKIRIREPELIVRSSSVIDQLDPIRLAYVNAKDPDPEEPKKESTRRSS